HSSRAPRDGPNDQNAVRVDLEGLARKFDRGRAELLYDGGAVEAEARRRHGAGVDGWIAEGAVEIDRAHRFTRRGSTHTAFKLGQFRPLDHAEAGDAEVHQLDLLAAGVVVAEGAQMGGVEGVNQCFQEPRIDRARWRPYPHLHRLAGVTDISFAGEADARGL